jgi:hypothetical protein
MIMNTYFEPLYACISRNTDEIKQFLERHNLPKFIQEGIDQLNRPICTKEIEPIINNISNRR